MLRGENFAHPRSARTLEASVSAWDTGLEARMNASAVGLLAVRVATAAARSRSGAPLNERDVAAVAVVRDDLREEAKVLRGEAAPDVSDETAYAFAGVALNALGVSGTSDTDRDADAAAQLDEVADELDALAQGRQVAPKELESLENLFLIASSMVSERLGQTGELVEGSPGA